MSQHVQDLDDLTELPKMFPQLGILVLDGSGSMSDMTADKISKADAVNLAVRDLLTRLQNSRMVKNFSVAVVTFNTSAKCHTPVTPVEQADDYGDYNPMQGHGGGTDIGAGLQCAQGIAEEFLSQASAHRVVIIVMSDGMSGGDPLIVAEELKQNPRITICSTYFRASGDDDPAAERLLRDMATSPLYYKTTYRAEDLRKFFYESMSSRKNVKTA